MNQFKKARLGPLNSQRLNSAQRNSTAAMHSKTRRFVNNQHPLVFKQNIVLQIAPKLVANGGCITLLSHTYGSNPDDITHFNAGIWLDAAFIDAHLTFA